jgi:hypothetical protein
VVVGALTLLLAHATAPPEPAEEGSAPMRSGIEPLPVSDADWPLPTVEELAQTREEPRYFDPHPGAVMFLTIEAIGLYEVPIFDSYSEEVLDWGGMHVPDTAYPWDGEDEKNVFIAGHDLVVEHRVTVPLPQQRDRRMDAADLADARRLRLTRLRVRMLREVVQAIPEILAH